MTTPRRGALLRLAVLAAVALGIVAPILAGIAETGRLALAAPEAALGLLRQPGFGHSLALTLWTGLAATGLSLLLAFATVAARGPAIARWIAPVLAAPHAALAIGLAFLLSPSGWIARLLAPLAGWERPPAWVTVGDPWGLALILGLVVKEVPFLILMLLAAVAQVAPQAHVAAARSMGYPAASAWVRVVLPLIWPLIRLPVLVVLGFSLTVVDVALILGPSSPPVLSVMVTRLLQNAAPDALPVAAAGALLLSVIVALAVAGVLGLESLAGLLGRRRLRRGRRGRLAGPVLRMARAGTITLLALALLAGVVSALWSLAFRWPWPEVLPRWSLAAWVAADWSPALTTACIGVAATGLSLLLAIAWLEGEDRGALPRAPWAEALVYLPLIVPQIAFLYGVSVVLLRLGLRPGLAPVIWTHALFVFPYVMIALSAPWRAVPVAQVRSAAALGAGPWRRLVAVKLPILLRPLLTAAAVGFAVSVALYLPTLFAGAGRVRTLTTEAVTLASGSDRRVVGVLGTLQAALPLAGFGLAVALPALAWRNRRALRGAA